MQNIFTDFEHPTFWGQKKYNQNIIMENHDPFMVICDLQKNKTALVPTQTPKSFIMEFQK